MSETRWLNADEMRLWRGFLEMSARVMQELDASLKANTELTLDDYEVLVHLSEAEDDKLRMSELSKRLLHSQSRLTQRVDRLQRRGLVARQKCTDDGRVTYAVITDRGREVITAAAPQHLNDVRSALVDVVSPDELPVVVEVFERIANRCRPPA